MRISDWSSDVCCSDLRMGGMRQLLQADRATDRHHHAPEAQRARYPYPGQGGRYYRHPAMLIGFGELGGIDAADHPVAPFGLGRGIAKRLGAYHPVAQGHQSNSAQFRRNLQAYSPALPPPAPPP